MRDLVFCLMGPTASGKTDLACALATILPLEIISVDSVMVYRHLNIGSAKPSADILAKTPHHLIDIIDPTETYSVAQFCQDATVLCKKIIKDGKIPLLVGGTMQYFHALQQGLSVLPEADNALRERLIAAGDLSTQLALIDPIASARIHAHDSQRLLRALEVFHLTGKTLSSLQSRSATNIPFDFVNIMLNPRDRQWLHTQIALRFDKILRAGLVEEVADLMVKWPLTAKMPAMRAVGYRQVLQFLAGEYNADVLRERGIAATRQLAKRQLTWLRSWDLGIAIDPMDADCLLQVQRLMNIAKG